MNENILAGEGRDIAGKVKETAGDLTGDRALQAEGLGDQLRGKAEKVVGAARDALALNGEPLLDRARRFVRERPFASATLAGVLGIAVLNTLRSRTRTGT